MPEENMDLSALEQGIADAAQELVKPAFDYNVMCEVYAAGRQVSTIMPRDLAFASLIRHYNERGAHVEIYQNGHQYELADLSRELSTKHTPTEKFRQQIDAERKKEILKPTAQLTSFVDQLKDKREKLKEDLLTFKAGKNVGRDEVQRLHDSRAAELSAEIKKLLEQIEDRQHRLTQLTQTTEDRLKQQDQTYSAEVAALEAQINGIDAALSTMAKAATTHATITVE